MSETSATRGSVWLYVIVALPALFGLGAQAVKRVTRPPSLLWQQADVLQYAFLLSPLCLIAFAFCLIALPPVGRVSKLFIAVLLLPTLYFSWRVALMVVYLMGLGGFPSR
jgi:hypothetical protein